MRCKKIVITMAIAGSFFLGIGISEPIKDARKMFHYEAAESFYERPYDLEIKHKKTVDGKIETYLYDEETNDYQKIGPNMYVGDKKHRIKSAGHAIIEQLEDEIEFLLDFYGFVFD